MIIKSNIKGFKRFADQAFDFRQLTVLTGMNGGGKSSVIHALLLTQEASQNNQATIALNGPYGLELGALSDVLNQETDAKSFVIDCHFEGDVSEKWEFSGQETELFAHATSRLARRLSSSDARSFQYLSAERLGPRLTQVSAALPPDLLEVGCRGEFCAHVIESMDKFLIEPARRCPDDLNLSLLLKAQTEVWLTKMTRKIQIRTASFVGSRVSTMEFRAQQDWVKPTNMGFGITYALPIILAALTACSGGLVIVENPEAHLHPAGQSQMGVFLATMAAAGVQIIVETHSDHLLNGIRRAIGEQKLLSASKAIVHYFDDAGSQPESLMFTEVGGISSWPKGFFDQYQLDISAITKIRRQRP